MIKKINSSEFVTCPRTPSDKIEKYFTCWDEQRQAWVTCDHCTLQKQYAPLTTDPRGV